MALQIRTLYDGIKKLKEDEAAIGSKLIKIPNDTQLCDGCEMGKHHRRKFSKHKVTQVQGIMDCNHCVIAPIDNLVCSFSFCLDYMTKYFT